MNMDRVQEWLTARNEYDRLDQAKKDAKEVVDTIEKQVLGEFERDGVNSVSVGGVTVYLQRDLRARPVAGRKDDLVAALVGTDLEWLVQPTINAQTLSAWVREQDKDDRPLPEHVAELVVVEEMFGVRARGR